MKKQRQTISGLNFWLISVAAFAMVIAAIVQYIAMRNSMFKEAELHARSELMATKQKIETAIIDVESLVSSSTSAVINITNIPDGLYALTQKILKDNTNLTNSIVAYKAGYWNKQDSAYAVCSYRNGDNILRKRLPDDYLNEDWFTNALKTGKPFWDEPFMNEGKLNTRCVVPIKDNLNQTFAVLAVSIPTDILTKDIKGLSAYPNSYAKLISKYGYKIIGPNGYFSESDALHFTEPVGNIGWKLTMVCPNSDIGNNILSGRILVLVLMCLGILLLGFIVINSLLNLRTLKEATEENSRMGDELEQARDRQSAMILKQPEDLPQRENLNISVGSITKSEVGGDFYDCFIENDKLYLCIGDVAGSGVPAALTMAMTLSAFRTATRHSDNPAFLMEDINAALCQQKKDKTTVKFLCGTLDLKTGELHYCNAGMHSPVLLTNNRNWEIEVDNNPRLGMSIDSHFTEQKTHLINENVLFFYTDELTEAKNSRGDKWGDKRLQALLESSFRMNSKELVNRIQKAITQHTDGAPLHDDITMMAIKYIQH
jgi:serine phosphatase RsbU (regulator of sigma subunit)